MSYQIDGGENEQLTFKLTCIYLTQEPVLGGNIKGTYKNEDRLLYKLLSVRIYFCAISVSPTHTHIVE